MPTGRVASARRGKTKSSAAPAARLCIVCRQVLPSLQLIQVKSIAGIDAAKKGRAAYVCIDRECLGKLHAKQFGRALRSGPIAVDCHGLTARLHSLAQTRILTLMGLAKRCGELWSGVDRLSQTASLVDDQGLQGLQWVCFVASDISPRSARRVQHGKEFIAAEAMGRAVGTPAVAALGIQPGRLAMQAAYWYRVWYETPVPSADTGTHVPTNDDPRRQNTARGTAHELRTD